MSQSVGEWRYQYGGFVCAFGGTPTGGSKLETTRRRAPKGSWECREELWTRTHKRQIRNSISVRASAVQESSSFFGALRLMGVDSEVALGLAGNSERVIAFLFDSFGTSHEGAPNSALFFSNNHVVAVPCPAPVELHLSDNGRVTCFAQGGEGKWLGLEGID